jgi:sRNA-binding carbon storage regulator CsrA
VRLGIEAPREMNIVREELCVKVPAHDPGAPNPAASAPPPH